MMDEGEVRDRKVADVEQGREPRNKPTLTWSINV